jgi:hypothetical protein
MHLKPIQASQHLHMNVLQYKYDEHDFVEQTCPIYNMHALQQMHYPKRNIKVLLIKRESSFLVKFVFYAFIERY